MPRYVIERTFPTGLVVATGPEGADLFGRIVRVNLERGVTWLHSYVTSDKSKTFCIYDAPSPEAVRHVARRNELPVDNVTEVSVLSPYFYY